MGLLISAFAFVAALVLTWRSLSAGLGAVLTVGYFFGIVRANFPDTYSHFIFDAAVFGFFVSFFTGRGLQPILDPNRQVLQRWVFLLIGWAVLMFLVPIQHPLIQLVGLRGHAFLLPFVLVGSRLRPDECNRLALWLSALNHVAFGFALAEYFVGVPAFYPENAVTELIYRSGDVANYTAFRIPATFSNAHSYGGTMITTLPWLLGAWIQPRLADWQRLLLASGMALAMIGVFLCAGRTPLILLVPILLVATFSGHLRGAAWLVWSLLIAGVAYVVSGEERMQRFMTLQDTDFVLSRIEGSVNLNFFELLLSYPFGNGIGAGGTSIPFFMQHYLREPVTMENEYCRILLEQGVVGLALWLAFIFWFVGRRPTDPRDSWLFGKRLLWYFSLVSFAIATTGLGLMTAIPQSMLFFIGIGFVTAPPALVRRIRKPIHRTGAASSNAPNRGDERSSSASEQVCALAQINDRNL